jgi:hypothetical protein
MKLATRVALVAAVCCLASRSEAQREIVARDGWEAFVVEWMGGDATRAAKRHMAILVLDDTSMTLYACNVSPHCMTNGKGPPHKGPPLYSIQLKSVKDVTSSSQFRGQGTLAKLALGGLAGDANDELVNVDYETASSAESPVFKTERAQSAALESKIRFRLKKLGVTIPEKK